MKAFPRFRNDDVSVDTELPFFRDFCAIFHKYGFRQVHAVTLYGLCNYKHTYENSYCVYAGYPTLSCLSNAQIKELSADFCFEDNTELIQYLQEIPDEIGLHGLYHTNYAKMSFEEQQHDMSLGLEILKYLFPNKKIRYFIPPFNLRNSATYAVAAELGLTVLGDEGVHLEENLSNLTLEPGIWYRYHHHRFYPTTTFHTLDLSLEALDNALTRSSILPQRTLPKPSFNYEGDKDILERSIQKHISENKYININTLWNNRKDKEVALTWIYSHIHHAVSIFDLTCADGSNLLWLSQFGYTHLGGSEPDPRLRAVAADIQESVRADWNIVQCPDMNPSIIPQETGVVLALNYFSIPEVMEVDSFLGSVAEKLSNNGVLILTLVDPSFLNYRLHAIHSSQWGLPAGQCDAPSEVKRCYSYSQVAQVAQKAGLHIAAVIPAIYIIPYFVYIFSKTSENISPRNALSVPAISHTDCEKIFDLLLESGEFDLSWYRDSYVKGPEIMFPLEHYIRFGAAKGYRPNKYFDTLAYRQRHMAPFDLQNPLLHAIIMQRFFASLPDLKNC